MGPVLQNRTFFNNFIVIPKEALLGGTPPILFWYDTDYRCDLYKFVYSGLDNSYTTNRGPLLNYRFVI